MKPAQYKVTLTGVDIPGALMHADDVAWSDYLTAFRKDPGNKKGSVSGDDRSPAWTWIGYCYHNSKYVGWPSDNIMTVLREGGMRTPTGKKNGNYKRQTQSGLMVAEPLWPLVTDAGIVPWEPIRAMIGETCLDKHIELANGLGFQLQVKRATIGTSKHVRVRPWFRSWMASGTVIVFDEDQSGITRDVLQRILDQAGSFCGLGDWRPSSKTPGTYGRFTATVE